MSSPLAPAAEPERPGRVECSLTRWAHWPQRTESPYFSLFYGAMSKYGVVPVADFEPTAAWLQQPSADVIHLHWPDALWRRGRRDAVQRIRGVLEFRRFLTAARGRGLTIVWTAHNVESHEGGDWLDRRAYRALARSADLVICHTRDSANEVTRRYAPPGTVLLMPHGNFDGVYPVPRRRDVVLAELGLDPTKPVFCCLGYLRAYKGLELACAAVHRAGRDVQLIIGGPPYKRHDLGPLRQWIAKMPQARLIERRLTEQEFADITAVSDAVLLPYLRVTTSGALLAAWSLGTGAIASDLPFFREIRDGVEGALQLFRPDDERDLVRAIEAYTGVPREQRQRSARSAAERYAWDTCVTPVAAWLEERRRSRAAANARSAED